MSYNFVVWMCGCVDVWMCGCVDVWMCGCVFSAIRHKICAVVVYMILQLPELL